MEKEETRAAAEGDAQELRQALAENEQKLKELVDRLKRLQADFENYKKRVAREREEDASRVEDRVLLDILPLYDNFERAFRSYSHNNDVDSFIEGMERIFSQFNDLLRGQDVRPIEALGKPFDPSLHEALLSVESEEKPNTVVEEFERGYLRGDRVLRPSRVKVSRRPQQPKREPKQEQQEMGEHKGQTREHEGGNG